MAQVPEITVEAPYHRPASAAKPAPGAKEALPEVSVDYKVHYADLDLSTHSGAAQLEKRIRDAATQACQQLATLYPASTEGVGKDSCVESATKKAMAEASTAIAAAEKSKK
jgi:UrcA family protein